MEVCSHNGLDPKTILLKINGTMCNLNCIYCSEIKKSHKSKIPLDQIKIIFNHLPFDSAIILHGGEPLLDLEYFKEVFFLFKKRNFKYKLSLQTNGVLNFETIDFLCENCGDINIGISIDGPEQQNLFRVDYSNNQIFDKVVQTIHIFEERGVNIKCIVTINAISVRQPDEILDFFLSFKNIKQLKFNPCFDSTNGKLNVYAINPMNFLKFLRILSYRWIHNHLYRRIHIDPLQSLAEKIMNENVFHYKYSCNNYISIYSDGKCTPCDALGDECFFVNNYSDIFTLNNQNDISTFKCISCSDYQICGGGCKAILLRFKENSRLLNEYCQYRKDLTNLIRALVKQ
jgi:uncharacterized protein